MDRRETIQIQQLLHNCISQPDNYQSVLQERQHYPKQTKHCLYYGSNVLTQCWNMEKTHMVATSVYGGAIKYRSQYTIHPHFHPLIVTNQNFCESRKIILLCTIDI